MGSPTLIDAPWQEFLNRRDPNPKYWENFISKRLDHIRSNDPNLKAWVNLDSEGALQSARQIDQSPPGNPQPLLGMPVGIKDIFDLKGFPTRAGISAWSDVPANADAVLVTRLKNAGAIVLGKTVTTPLACFDPPATRNPWNPNHTPGGSSSGSAVALAACHIAGALGSQTGGSLCRPASYCGVCAMKPTFGLLPTDGMVPVSLELDHPGPMARNMEDLGLIFKVLTGQNQINQNRKNPEPHESLGQNGSNRPIRLGAPSGIFSTETADPLRHLFLGHIQLLGKSGIQIEEVELPPEFGSLFRAHYDLMSRGAFLTHKERFAKEPQIFPPRVSELILEGEKLPHLRIDQARSLVFHLRQKLARLMDKQDAWILPGFHEFPPGPESTGTPRFHAPWSFLGWPEISFAAEVAPNGLPVAIQVVGRPHSDLALLEIARRLSKILGRPKLPPVGC